MNGARLYFERRGTGLPIVFVSQFAMDHRLWAQHARVLARQYEVITYDSRGSGHSGRGPGPYRDAADLAGLLDALQVEHATVVGHLDGAEVALELALDRPNLVRSLILVSPKCGSLTLQVVNQYLLEGRSSFVEPYNAQTRRQLWVRRMAAARMWMMISNVIRTIPVYWHREQLDQYVPQRAAPPASERLREIEAPALIVVGGQTNGVSRDVAEILVTNLAHARLATVPDVGPYPSIPLEAPIAFIDTVKYFLQEQDDPPAR